MPVVTISERDLLRGKVIPPAWYRVKIEDVTEGLAASGTSTNYTVDATVIKNAENGATDGVAGVPLSWIFNSKAIGFVVPFLEAFGITVTPGRYDLDAAKGKEVEVFNGNKVYNNRQLNDPQHQYRPAK